MSIPVDLHALREELAGYDRPAYLVTAGDGGPPHMVAQYLTWADGAFETDCGGTTARNLSQRDAVSVVVPPNEPDGYSLIFDATGEVVEGERRMVRLTPTKAVLHRPGTRSGDDGSCGHDCAPIGTTLAGAAERAVPAAMFHSACQIRCRRRLPFRSDVIRPILDV